ncbi:hypothetical protein [Rhizobium phaseoli]|uniref:hypothetical protein n=1 Tax=Rhizobium phaseoli TaxID=396 RepID=UPI0014857416|nr:hypothetical protein [Rhizobium phaseoli]
MASIDRAERAAGHVTANKLDVVDLSSHRGVRARHHDRDVVVESDSVAGGETEFGGESGSSAKQRPRQQTSVSVAYRCMDGHVVLLVACTHLLAFVYRMIS